MRESVYACVKGGLEWRQEIKCERAKGHGNVVLLSSVLRKHTTGMEMSCNVVNVVTDSGLTQSLNRDTLTMSFKIHGCSFHRTVNSGEVT